MAEKVSKKTVKKAEVKNTNSPADLRALSPEELQKKLQSARADLLEMQRSLRANELANPRVVRMKRREIARILTIITATAKQPTENKEEK